MSLDQKPRVHTIIYPPPNLLLSSSMREVVIRTPSPPLSFHFDTNFNSIGCGSANDSVVDNTGERYSHNKQLSSSSYSSSSSSSSSMHSSANFSSHTSSSNSISPSSTQMMDSEEKMNQPILQGKQKESNVENSVQQQCVFVLEPKYSMENVSEICIQCCNEEQRKEWYDAIGVAMENATTSQLPQSSHLAQLKQQQQQQQQIYKCGWLLRDGKERWFVLDFTAAILYWKKDRVHAIKKMDGVIQGFKKWIDLRNYCLVQRIIYMDSSSFSHSSTPPSPSLYQSLENTKSTIRRAFSRVASLRGVVERFKEEKSASDSLVEQIPPPLTISSPSQFQHVSTLGSPRQVHCDVHASKPSKSLPQLQTKSAPIDEKNSFRAVKKEVRAAEKEFVQLENTTACKEAESKISKTRQDVQVLQAQLQTIESELKQLKTPKQSTTPYGVILMEDNHLILNGDGSTPLNRKSHIAMRNSDRYCEHNHEQGNENNCSHANDMGNASSGDNNKLLASEEVIYDRVESLRMNKEMSKYNVVQVNKQDVDVTESLKQAGIASVEYGDLPRDRTVLMVVGGDKMIEINNVNSIITTYFDPLQNAEQHQDGDISTSNEAITNKISPRKSRTNSRSVRKKSQTKHIC
jgi:hypothetical protein